MDADLCVHCGGATAMAADPAPDLCIACRTAGRWSPMWGSAEDTRYQATVQRLAQAAAVHGERYGVPK